MDQKFFLVRHGRIMKEIGHVFVESELRACGADRSAREMYFASPFCLKCEKDPSKALWLIPEQYINTQKVSKPQ